MSPIRQEGAFALIAILGVTAGCSSDDSSPERPSETETVSSGPTTLEDACGLLLGPEDMLVEDTLTVGSAIAKGDSSGDTDRVSIVQNKLFELVVDGPAKLQDPAGTLVDYLDDPAEYADGDGVSSTITEAVDDIETVCGK